MCYRSAGHNGFKNKNRYYRYKDPLDATEGAIFLIKIVVAFQSFFSYQKPTPTDFKFVFRPVTPCIMIRVNGKRKQ